MKKNVDSYKFSVFGKFDYISESDNDRYLKLREQIEALGDIMRVEQQVRFELKITNNNQPPMPMQTIINKPLIISKDNMSKVNFFDDRIDFLVQVGKDNDSDLQYYSSKFIEYINIINAVYELNINRISINFENVYSDFTDEESLKIQDVFCGKKLKDYTNALMKEWNVGFCIRKKINDLYINVITNVIRGKMMKNNNLNEVPKDLIVIHFDINTVVDSNVKILIDRIGDSFNVLTNQYNDIVNDLGENIG